MAERLPAIVNLTEAAIPRLLEIENQVSYPSWNNKLFQQEFSNKYSQIYGARLHGKLAAFLIVHTVLDEIHVVNLAVAQEFRRKGIAAHLLSFVFSDLGWNGARRAYLEVRIGNLEARALYEKLGFLDVGIRPKYYSNNNEDAQLMCLDLEYFLNELADKKIVVHQ